MSQTTKEQEEYLLPTPEIAQCFLQFGQQLSLLEAYPDLALFPDYLLKSLDYKALVSDDASYETLIKLGHAKKASQTQIVNAYILIGNLRLAKSALKTFHLPIQDYPEVLFDAYRGGFTHWLHAADKTLVEIVRLCKGDDEASAALVQWALPRHHQAAAAAWYVGLSEEGRGRYLASLRRACPQFTKMLTSHTARDAEKWCRSDFISFDDVRNGIYPLPPALMEPDAIKLEDFDICLSDLIVVNNLEQFQECLEAVHDAPVVAIDSEWRPVLVTQRRAQVALFQIALPVNLDRMKIYLIDVRAFRDADPEEYKTLIFGLSEFCARETAPVKIGFNFAGDMRNLHQTANCDEAFTSLNNYVDFSEYVKGYLSLDVEVAAYAQVKNDGIPVSAHSWRGGLADGCGLIYLGKKLLKGPQCSNWELRPLSIEQAVYAALDTASLLYAVQKFVRKYFPSGDYKAVTFHNEQCKAQTKRESDESKPNSAVTKVNQEEKLQRFWNDFITESNRQREIWRVYTRTFGKNGDCRSRRPREFLKFILPSDEIKLSKTLRGIGLDVLRCRHDNNQMGKVIAEADLLGRILLATSGKNTSSKHTATLQYNFRSSNLSDRVKEIIYVFEIEYDADALCSRCSECNSNNWQPLDRMVTLPPTVIKRNEEFRICGTCGKIYWEGTMWNLARGRFTQLFMEDFTFHKSSRKSSSNDRETSGN